MGESLSPRRSTRARRAPAPRDGGGEEKDEQSQDNNGEESHSPLSFTPDFSPTNSPPSSLGSLSLSFSVPDSPSESDHANDNEQTLDAESSDGFVERTERERQRARARKREIESDEEDLLEDERDELAQSRAALARAKARQSRDREEAKQAAEAHALAATVAQQAALAAAPAPSPDECCVCGFDIRQFKAGDYANHLRTQHAQSSYVHHTSHLTSKRVGLCPTGGEARPMMYNGQVFAHHCRRAGPPIQEEDAPRPAGWEDSPWPEGVPYPPAGMPHPLTLGVKGKLVARVPNHFADKWAGAFATACNALADALEAGTQGDIGARLVDFLQTPSCLRKKRGGKAHKGRLGKQIEEFSRRLGKRTGLGGMGEVEVEEGVEREAKSGEEPLDAEEKRRLAEVSRRVGLGWLSRAARLVRSDEGINKPSEASTATLRGKFPAPRTPINLLDDVPDNAPHFIVDEEEEGAFADMLSGVLKATAGGRSGLQGEHIKPLLLNGGALMALQRVITHLLDGDFPAWAHPYLVTSRLVSLGAKERPVCVGEWVVRACSALCNRTVSEQEDRAFFLQKIEGRYVLQLGNAVKGGTEVAIHMLQDLAHTPLSEHVTVSDDGRNAYNSTDRVRACNRTMEQFPSTARWVHWFYGSPAMLVHGDEVVMAGEGALQGDPLGGRIHDTLFQDVLVETTKRAAKHTPGEMTHVVAYRDDSYIVGKAGPALYAHAQLQEVRKELMNVDGSPAKFEAYVPRQTHATDTTHEAALALATSTLGEGRANTRGIEALGAPITLEQAYREEILDSKMSKYPSFLPRLKRLDIKTALPLLRFTLLPIPTYLTRVLYPTLIAPHARKFDQDIYDTYKAVAGDAALERDDEDLVRPARLGGQGLRSVERTSPIAHFCSLVNAMYALKDKVTEIGDALEHFRFYQAPDPPDPPDRPPPFPAVLAVGLPHKLAVAWALCHNTIFRDSPSEFFPESLPLLFRNLAHGFIQQDQYQKTLTAEMEEARADAAEADRSQEGIARNISNRIRGSSALLSATPTPAFNKLSFAAFSTHLKLRAGTYVMPHKFCKCGKQRLTAEHCLSCSHMKGVIIRHDVLVESITQMFLDAGKVARSEVRVIAGTQMRMDVVVYSGASVLWIDVSVVNPLAPSYIAHPKTALKRREQAKKSKWEAHATARGITFMPFVVNVYGGLGEDAINVLQRLSSAALQNYPYRLAVKSERWLAKYRAEASQRITAGLAHINHLLLEEAQVRALGKHLSGKFYAGAKKLCRIG